MIIMMKKKNKWKITAAAILGTAGILTAGYLYWCTTLDDKVIWKDVSINWVALQGKTIEAAEKAVQEQFKKDYGDMVSPNSLANTDAQEWTKEMVKRLKSKPELFTKRDIKEYLS